MILLFIHLCPSLHFHSKNLEKFNVNRIALVTKDDDLSKEEQVGREYWLQQIKLSSWDISQEVSTCTQVYMRFIIILHPSGGLTLYIVQTT